ncbi:MAG: HTH domain-containing protein [Clostridia bacterium]|nr:HTH domain-containing protein [Clostridia bacterium]
MKLNCFDRRIEIFLYLCRHRNAKTRDLAREFSVSRKTIIRDIMILSKYVPLYTKFGRYGGVFIMDDYRNELFLYLSKDEEQLLKMLLIERTDEKERFLLKSIINHYGMPTFERQKCF